jgi:hypothetical protein
MYPSPIEELRDRKKQKELFEMALQLGCQGPSGRSQGVEGVEGGVGRRSLVVWVGTGATVFLQERNSPLNDLGRAGEEHWETRRLQKKQDERD